MTSPLSSFEIKLGSIKNMKKDSQKLKKDLKTMGIPSLTEKTRASLSSLHVRERRRGML
jgi:hypothetical protein